MRVRWGACAALSAVVFLLGSCGGTTINPTPAVSALYPETVAATLAGASCANSPSPFTLNVAGNNFMDGSVAYWNGSKRATTFDQNTGQLAVKILACDIVNPGIDYVSVVNPPPGGGPSQAAAPFQVTQPAPAAIKSISPASTTQNVLPPGGILTIHGESAGAVAGSTSSGFTSDSRVSINGSARAVTYVNSAELQVELLPSDVAVVGGVNVTVTNPGRGGSSNAQFSVTDPPNAANFPRVISVSATGGAANGASSSPAMSADGRYIAFYSEATNLVAAGVSGNIFVRDTCIGATANCTPHTIAVDLAPDSSAPNAPSGESVAISANGRHVAFVSYATNLVSGIDTTPVHVYDNGFVEGPLNVFVRDLCFGAPSSACTPRTSLVSQTATGKPSTLDAALPSISADGRFVAFFSGADDLAPGLSESRSHVFVRDTCAGVSNAVVCTPQTFGFGADPADPRIVADTPLISASARYIVMDAYHDRPGVSAPYSEIRLLDTCLGSDVPANCARSSTVRVSVLSDGSPVVAENSAPSVSGDGRFVVFESRSLGSLSDVLSENLKGPAQLFLRDTCLGSTAPADCVPSTTALGSDSDRNFSPWVSPSGRFITFSAGAAHPNSAAEVYAGSLVVQDTCAGPSSSCSPSLYAVNSKPALVVPVQKSILLVVPLSADGRFAAFSSDATNLASPTSGLGDVFLMQMPTGAAQQH